jgi:hypothetical protein
MDGLKEVEVNLSRLSAWIDAGKPPHISDDAQLWHRLGKISEENGELTEALIGVLGMNPRKGFSHTWADVDKEILDVIVTGFCAMEHRHSNAGVVAEMVLGHVRGLMTRAGLDPVSRPPVAEGDRIRVLEWEASDGSAPFMPATPYEGVVNYVGSKLYPGQPTVYVPDIRLGCFASSWAKLDG